jgi:farnesyl diphosphate synthase
VLRAFAHDLGLAFQMTDDLLDVEGSQKRLGKGVQRDSRAGKATFIAALGPDRARSQAGMLAEQAVEHLDAFGAKADFLRQLARFAVRRDA